MRIRFFTWVFCLLLVACTQGEGDVCQSNRDCDDGLVCTLDDDARGFCQKPEDVDRTPPAVDEEDPDLEPDPDGAVDAGGDAGDAAVTPDEDAG